MVHSINKRAMENKIKSIKIDLYNDFYKIYEYSGMEYKSGGCTTIDGGFGNMRLILDIMFIAGYIKYDYSMYSDKSLERLIKKCFDFKKFNIFLK